MAKTTPILMPCYPQRRAGAEAAEAAHGQRARWYTEIRKEVDWHECPDLFSLLVQEFKFHDLREFIRWHALHYKACDVSIVKGPHWRTLLRMLAIKHRPEQFGHIITDIKESGLIR